MACVVENWLALALLADAQELFYFCSRFLLFKGVVPDNIVEASFDHRRGLHRNKVLGDTLQKRTTFVGISWPSFRNFYFFWRVICASQEQPLSFGCSGSPLVKVVQSSSVLSNGWPRKPYHAKLALQSLPCKPCHGCFLLSVHRAYYQLWVIWTSLPIDSSKFVELGNKIFVCEVVH